MRRRDHNPLPPARLTALAGAVGCLATAAVLAVPWLRFAYRSVEGHLVLETVAALVAALVALLLYGRFRRSGSLQELLLVHAMAFLAIAAFGLVAIPIAVGADITSAVTTWAPLLVRFAAAVLFLVAALVPGRQVTRRADLTREAVVIGALLVAVVMAATLLDEYLPSAVTALSPPEASGHPRFEGHRLVIALQLANLACYAAASVAFTRQAQRTSDELVSWLGAAAAINAWARINYLLYPSIYSEWLYWGDLLRLLFYLLLLIGAVREIHAYWTAQAEAAVLYERRRLARDLHDGAVQELGYIAAQARTLSSRPDRQAPERILAAADRALDETRRAVAALSAPPEEPLADTLERAACEIAGRYHVALRTGLDPTVDVPFEHREALVRITREAVANAARHGRPQQVEVRLRPGELIIADDGQGFDPLQGGRPGGFGLTSMRDRAAGIGAQLTIDSAMGTGTQVVVRWR